MADCYFQEKNVDKPAVYEPIHGPNWSHLNTQYMTNPTIVSSVKMELGWNFSISSLEMMVKSGLDFFKKFKKQVLLFLWLSVW